MKTENCHKKRIAYLSSRYPAVSHTFIQREILGLRERGLDVFAASIRRPGRNELLSETDSDEYENTFYITTRNPFLILLDHLLAVLRSPCAYFGALVYALSLSHGGVRNTVWTIFYFIEAVTLMSWCRRKGIAHVHVHFGNPAATVAMIASSRWGITYSMTLHGPDVFFNCKENLLAQKIERALFVVCISDFCRSMAMLMSSPEHWRRLHIVHCGVDPESFSPGGIGRNGVLNILYVGRLAPAKGQHVLLKACSILAERGVEYHCEIVGGGERRADLEAESRSLGLNGRVHFAGAVGQDSIQDYYDKADVFVLPSFAEGVPVVLMEAMAKEIPCISTRIAGIPELIDNERNGMLVTPGRADQVAAAVARFERDESLRVRMGKNARRTIESDFNINTNAKKLSDIFRESVLDGGDGV